MKKILLALIGSVLITLGLINPAMAYDDSGTSGQQKTNTRTSTGFGEHASNGLKEVSGETKVSLGDIVTKIINFMLFVVGIVGVIMIIYAGIQYVTSAGDSGKVASAKNTLFYAIIGLVVAILAYALVSFITKNFLK